MPFSNDAAANHYQAQDATHRSSSAETQARPGSDLAGPGFPGPAVGSGANVYGAAPPYGVAQALPPGPMVVDRPTALQYPAHNFQRDPRMSAQMAPQGHPASASTPFANAQAQVVPPIVNGTIPNQGQSGPLLSQNTSHQVIHSNSLSQSVHNGKEVHYHRIISPFDPQCWIGVAFQPEGTMLHHIIRLNTASSSECIRWVTDPSGGLVEFRRSRQGEDTIAQAPRPQLMGPAMPPSTHAAPPGQPTFGLSQHANHRAYQTMPVLSVVNNPPQDSPDEQLLHAAWILTQTQARLTGSNGTQGQQRAATSATHHQPSQLGPYDLRGSVVANNPSFPRKRLRSGSSPSMFGRAPLPPSSMPSAGAAAPQNVGPACAPSINLTFHAQAAPQRPQHHRHQSQPQLPMYNAPAPAPVAAPSNNQNFVLTPNTIASLPQAILSTVVNNPAIGLPLRNHLMNTQHAILSIFGAPGHPAHGARAGLETMYRLVNDLIAAQTRFFTDFIFFMNSQRR